MLALYAQKLYIKLQFSHYLNVKILLFFFFSHLHLGKFNRFG